jgi:hypothetical protein
MATRSFTTTSIKLDGAFPYSIGLIEGTATANKLVDTDVTDTITTKGVKVVRATGTYIKGSSTNGKIDIVVDGIVRASSSTSTTVGEILSATVTLGVNSSVYIKATITGTATGASVNYALLSISDPLTNS